MRTTFERLAVLLMSCACFATCCAAGCAARSDKVTDQTRDVIFLVPGAGGPSHEYQRLIGGLRAGGTNRPVQVVTWGAPRPLFFLNFSNESIHDSAESALARRIVEWRQSRPGGRIDLIGHSAGGGVVLGALGKLDPSIHVHTILLLAPSVSPTYDLRSALAHVDAGAHVFHSDRDTVFLSWRTGNFGTYDNVKTRAAGNAGFDVSSLDEALRARLTQHPYDERWNSLDNDGGHFGTLSHDFARDVLAPLLL